MMVMIVCNIHSGNVKYYIVFAPKHRRQAIYEKKNKKIGKISSEFCEHKGVEIIEASLWADHVHILESIPLK